MAMVLKTIMILFFLFASWQHNLLLVFIHDELHVVTIVTMLITGLFVLPQCVPHVEQTHKIAF
jgi:hypothetical protein